MFLIFKIIKNNIEHLKIINVIKIDFFYLILFNTFNISNNINKL